MAKTKQHIEAELLLLKVTCFLHPRYHPKIKDILKMVPKLVRLFIWSCMVNSNENVAENEKLII